MWGSLRLAPIITYRLTYFDGRGLGERIRYILAETNTPYEERVITKELLGELRAKGDLMFQQLPLLEIDGLKIVQSHAIVRYIARKHGLCGRTDRDAVVCDMVYGGLSDFVGKILGSVFQEDRAAFLSKQVEPLIERYLSPLKHTLCAYWNSSLLSLFAVISDY